VYEGVGVVKTKNLFKHLCLCIQKILILV